MKRKRKPWIQFIAGLLFLFFGSASIHPGLAWAALGLALIFEPFVMLRLEIERDVAKAELERAKKGEEP